MHLNILCYTLLLFLSPRWDNLYLKGKIKKHQAFEAEILRNEDALVDLKTTGDEMLEAKHYAHERITAALESITAQWDFLKMKTDEKKKRLTEALELLVFDREADEVSTWISSKTLIASVEDVGKVIIRSFCIRLCCSSQYRFSSPKNCITVLEPTFNKDLEYNEVLQKTFEDFVNEISANETRVDGINSTSLNLISAAHPGQDAIKSKIQVHGGPLTYFFLYL